MDGALERYDAVKNDMDVGRTPRPAVDGPTADGDRSLQSASHGQAFAVARGRARPHRTGFLAIIARPANDY
jgi:hypothetical protein